MNGIDIVVIAYNRDILDYLTHKRSGQGLQSQVQPSLSCDDSMII